MTFGPLKATERLVWPLLQTAHPNVGVHSGAPGVLEEMQAGAGRGWGVRLPLRETTPDNWALTDCRRGCQRRRQSRAPS